MLDRWTMKWVQPALKKTAGAADRLGLTASQISVAGFLIGLSTIPALWQEMYGIALLMGTLNRILDGLDGALARLRQPTDAGGFLDITLDFIFYSAVVFGFALADPGRNAIAAAFLIFAFVGTGSSFLAFAAMAAKHGIKSIPYPHKSLHYLGGLTEGTETIVFFILFCLFPVHFPTLAVVFAALCWLTTVIRIIQGYRRLIQIEKTLTTRRQHE